MYYTYVWNGDVIQMSFWSWIGLADKSEILALQSEMSILREENRTLFEQNNQLIEKMQDANKRSLNIVIKEITNNRERTEEIIQNTNERIEYLVKSSIDFKREIMSSNKQIDIVINECIRSLNEIKHIVGENSDTIQQVFNSECGNIRDKLELISEKLLEDMNIKFAMCSTENNDILMKIEKYEEVITKVDELISISKNTQQRTDSIDDVQETLIALSEYVKYMWTITKAIWVDSVLSDIDTSI